MSKLSWISLTCEAKGTVNRADRMTQFVEFHIHARLKVPSGANVEQGKRLLVRAEETCLVTNSLKTVPSLETEVEVSLEH
jgi:uncharacterized OsmC-like protein